MPIGPALGAPRRFRSLVRWGLQVKPLGYHQRRFDAAVQGAAFSTPSLTDIVSVRVGLNVE